MISQVSQKEFNRKIFLVALAMCFKSSEEYLSEEQINCRGYTPIESYGKSCIAKLIDEGAIQFKIVEPTFPFGGAESTLFIKRPVSPYHELERFICSESETIAGLLKSSVDYQLYLKSLYLEILVCEALEYANYHAHKNGLDVKNASHTNARLKLMLAENSPMEVNAFIWRAIKEIKKKSCDNISSVDFSDIAGSAFSFYVRHQKLNIEIDGYDRPAQLKTSRLSELLEFFMVKLGCVR